MKKSELRQLIREEYKKVSKKEITKSLHQRIKEDSQFKMTEYENVLQSLNNGIAGLKSATMPDNSTVERQIKTFQKKLEKLTDDYETLLMKLDKL